MDGARGLTVRMAMPLPVTYLTQLLPAYRLPVLRRLGERLGQPVTVYCGAAPSRAGLDTLAGGDRDGIQHEAPVRTFAGGQLTFQAYRQALQAAQPEGVLLVEENPRNVALPLLLRAARQQRVPTVLWGHFSSNNRPFDPEKHPADRYRRWLARQATACLTYTDPLAQMLQQHVPPHRVFTARNTLDTDTLFGLDDALRTRGRAAVRADLGLPADALVLVYLGRLIPDKRIDLLLPTLEALRKQRSTHLVVIGDGPERASLEAAARHLDGVHLLGAMPELEASAPYLFAADVLLNPGYVGLSVNHAFSLELPVVTCTPSEAGRYHSPEADFLADGHNARLAQQHPDDLASAVLDVAAERDRYSAAARTYARHHLTLGKMVEGMVAALQFAQISS